MGHGILGQQDDGLFRRRIDEGHAVGAHHPQTRADGRLRLSWTEPLEDGGHILRFAVWEGAGWSPARTIASGDDWFVNWADVPTLTAFADGTLVATWLAMLGEGTYAYGVSFSMPVA